MQLDGVALSWEELVQSIPVQGLVRELARNTSLKSRTKDALVLSIAPHLNQLAKAKHIEELSAALSNHLDTKIKIEVITETSSKNTPVELEEERLEKRKTRSEEALKSDPRVLELERKYGAVIESVALLPK